MARVFLTPGVYKQEIDISDILVSTGISNGGIVIRSKKGPVNRPVLVTNDKEFIEVFGEPIFTSGLSLTAEQDKLIPEYGYGAYAALEFLKESNTLYVVRDYTPAEDTYAWAEFDTNLDFTLKSVGISGTKFVRGNRLDRPDYISVIDNWAANNNEDFMVAYVGPGTDGNSVAVTIEPFSLSADWKFTYDEYPTSSYAASAASLTNAEIETWYPIASKVFKMNVYKKNLTSNWDSLYRNQSDRSSGKVYIRPEETFYGSLKRDLKDANGNDLFIETIVNGNSEYIYVKHDGNFDNFAYVNSISEISALPIAEDSNEEEYVKFSSSATTGSSTNRLAILSGGLSDLTVNAGLDDTQGLAIFEDRENVNVQILIGTSWVTATKQEIARIAATRADCIATVQVGQPNDDSVSTIHSREDYGYRTPSYVAIYGGFSKIYDQYNDKFVYLPNSILGAALFARVDNVANPWDAPAGVNRAVLSVLDQRKIFTFDEIGKLYDRNINVPRFIRGTGHVMWGQKTAQLKASALDRINVRRNLLYIENNVEIALLPFVFENNTAKTRLRVFSLVDEFLAGVQAGGGLTTYKVVVDESNNTPAVIDANRLNVDIYVQPSRAIEFIQLTTVITRTGVSFEEVRIATA
jgi:phage tail sheath protein FI